MQCACGKIVWWDIVKFVVIIFFSIKRTFAKYKSAGFDSCGAYEMKKKARTTFFPLACSPFFFFSQCFSQYSSVYVIYLRAVEKLYYRPIQYAFSSQIYFFPLPSPYLCCLTTLHVYSHGLTSRL